MWSTIANLKENLNKIALDVHDEDEEDESSVSDRRNSNGFAGFKSGIVSPLANGVDRVSFSEDLIVRLNKENGSVKQNLEATNAALSASRIEGSRASTSGTFSIKMYECLLGACRFS